MAKPLTARLRQKNQVTLPRKLVDRIGLHEGDFVTFEVLNETKSVEPGSIILRPQHLLAKSAQLSPSDQPEEQAAYPGVRTAIKALKQRL